MGKAERTPIYLVIIALVAALSVAGYFSYINAEAPNASQPKSIETYPVVVVQPAERVIKHGDVQLLNVYVTSQIAKKPLEGARVDVVVTLPDLSTITATGVTGKDGSFRFILPISQEYPSGSYQVRAVVNAPGYVTGIGNGAFTVVGEGITPQPKYAGSIDAKLSTRDNATVAVITLDFSPPTESGIILFVRHPDGAVTRHVIADVGVRIATVSPSVRLDASGMWEFWALSGGVKSKVVVMSR